MNFHRFDSVKRNRLQNVYVFIQTCLSVFYITFQTWNVITRATRYFPELVQTFFENFLQWVVLYVLIYFRTIYRNIIVMQDTMNDLCKLHNPVMEKCHRTANIVLLSFICAVSFALAGSILETMIPLSESELEIRRNIYRTNKYPERRLPYNTHIPFIDESVSWSYEIIYVYQIYIILCFIVSSSFMVSIVPISMVYVRGQYEILCKYIQMIGQDHRDSLGCKIFYTNIEKNEYSIKLYSPILPKNKQNKMKVQREKLRAQIRYEQNYVRQIVKYHQKLLRIQHLVRQKKSIFRIQILMSSL